MNEVKNMNHKKIVYDKLKSYGITSQIDSLNFDLKRGYVFKLKNGLSGEYNLDEGKLYFENEEVQDRVDEIDELDKDIEESNRSSFFE
jgi:hypothetical protein